MMTYVLISEQVNHIESEGWKTHQGVASNTIYHFFSFLK